MITTNIDVTDGLTNGAMGTVTNAVIDQTTGKMSVILVAFDSEHVGQETRYISVYNSRNQNAVQIHETLATFPVHKKTSFQATSINTGLGCHNTQMSRTCTFGNCHRYDMCKRQVQTWKSICSLQ